MSSVRVQRAGVAVAATAAIVPTLVGLVRSLHRGWYPVGDNGYFALRARDVFTDHHPLLGTWTSASLSVGENLNNPGPLLFDIYALPARIDAASGVAVGAALVNVASVAIVGLFAYRQGGATAATVFLACATALGWSMGSELLIDPWQPHVLMLPSLAFFVLIWSLLNGDLVAFPLTVGVASLIVQTHFGYVVLVTALSMVGIAGVIWTLRRRTRGDTVGSDRQMRTMLLCGAAIAVVCWIQPVIEQLTADGRGNLTRLAAAGSSGGDSLGASGAARLVAGVVVTPPAWFRPSLRDTYAPELVHSPDGSVLGRHAGVPSLGAAIIALVLLAVVLAAAAWLAIRRDDRPSLLALVVGAVALVAATITLSILPIASFGLAPHQFRWLWSLAAFLVAATALALVGQRRATILVAAVTALVIGAANLPTHRVQVGPPHDARRPCP